MSIFDTICRLCFRRMELYYGGEWDEVRKNKDNVLIKSVTGLKFKVTNDGSIHISILNFRRNPTVFNLP